MREAALPDLDASDLMDPQRFLSELPTARFPEGNPRRYFHSAWYIERYLGGTSGDIDPWDHYVLVGERSGALPHPLFIPNYYRSQAQEHGGLALEHYARFGIQRMIHPHPLVRPTRPRQGLDWFAENDDPQIAHLVRPVPSRTAGSTLLRYLLIPDAEWRHPNPLFDRVWYRQHVGGEIDQFGDALAHYLAIGGHRGLPTGRDIEWRPFLDRRPDLLLQSRTPMEHVLLHEKPGSFTFGVFRPEALITQALADDDVEKARALIAAWYLDNTADWSVVDLASTPVSGPLEVRELSGSLLLSDGTTGNLLGTPSDVHVESSWWATDRCVLLKHDRATALPTIGRCVLFDPIRVGDPGALGSAVATAEAASIPLITTTEVGAALRLLAHRCGIDINVRRLGDGVVVGEVVIIDRDLSPSGTRRPAHIHVSAQSRATAHGGATAGSLTSRGLLALLDVLPGGSEVTVSNSLLLPPTARRQAESTARSRNIELELIESGAPQ